MPTLFDNFGRHPIRCPTERLSCILSFDDLFGATEVGQFARAILLEENVRSLNVPMDDVVEMEILQTKENLLSVVG